MRRKKVCMGLANGSVRKAFAFELDDPSSIRFPEPTW